MHLRQKKCPQNIKDLAPIHGGLSAFLVKWEAVEQAKFERVALHEVPKDELGCSKVDLYVHLPSSNKYIRFIASGDVIEPQKLEALKMHPVPELFRKQGGVEAAPAAPDPEIPQQFQQQILGKALNKELKDVYKYIAGDTADTTLAVKRFEAMSDTLVGTIAPDAKALNDHLKRQARNLALMSDSAAISTLAIICAFANGFDSRKSFRELSYATLVMDLSLSEFTEDQLKLYYSNRAALPPEVLKDMLQHPMRSYQLAEQKLKSLSDITMQLILTHHELYNGKGYPRGIRTESLFPIARVLSLAVDSFERLKKSEILQEKKSLMDVFIELRDEVVEPHMRRHSKKLVEAVVAFFSSQDPDAVPERTEPDPGANPPPTT